MASSHDANNSQPTFGMAEKMKDTMGQMCLLKAFEGHLCSLVLQLGHHSYEDHMSGCGVKELDGPEVPPRPPSQGPFPPLGDLSSKQTQRRLAASCCWPGRAASRCKGTAARHLQEEEVQTPPTADPSQAETTGLEESFGADKRG